MFLHVPQVVQVDALLVVSLRVPQIVQERVRLVVFLHVPQIVQGHVLLVVLPHVQGFVIRALLYVPVVVLEAVRVVVKEDVEEDGGVPVLV